MSRERFDECLKRLAALPPEYSGTIDPMLRRAMAEHETTGDITATADAFDRAIEIGETKATQDVLDHLSFPSPANVAIGELLEHAVRYMPSWSQGESASFMLRVEALRRYLEDVHIWVESAVSENNN